AALVRLARLQGWRSSERTLGVVGVGHVGSLVAEYAAAWGFRVLCCDPPREAREQLGFLPLEAVAREADVLTLHVPLDDSTRHMAGCDFLRLLRPDAVVLNTSRGEVVDTAALLSGGHPCMLDVWENEPLLDRTLLAGAWAATPHVAGYSEQGKANAAAMSVGAVARRFGLPLAGWYPPQVVSSAPRPISWEELCATIDDYCDLEAETRRLKAHPENFEQLRDEYRYRKEYF
ncbi:MAG: 4-phosphoerythronate dehydrogenase, partial [Alistipes senegalensis]|nr:4-phosphoerythronate dehydrogenase [Alistipes senegalensis]